MSTDEQKTLQATMRDLMVYVGLIWKNKWYILVSTIICGLLAFAVAYSIPDIYESYTVILIEKQKVPEQFVKSAVSGDVGDRVATIKQQILSRSNIKKIIADFDISPDSEVSQSHIESIKKMIIQKIKDGKLKIGHLLKKHTGKGFGLLKVPDVEQKKRMEAEELLKLVTGNIVVSTVGRGRDVSSFKVAYKGKEPEKVKNIANRLASNFVDKNLQLREKMVEGTTEFLQNELSIQQRVLEEQEAKIGAYKKEHMGSLPGQLQSNLAALGRMQKEQTSLRESIVRGKSNKLMLEDSMIQVKDLFARRMELLKKEKALHDSINAGIASSMAVNQEKNTVRKPTALEVQVIRMEHELETLQARFKNTYPDIVILKNRLKKLKVQLEAEHESMAKNELERLALDKKNASSKILSDLDKEKEITKGKLKKSMQTLEVSRDQISLDTDNSLKRIKNSIKSQNMELRELKNRDKQIVKELALYRERVENTPMREQELAILQRDYANIQKHYETLLSKKLQAKIAENLEKRQKGEQFRVLDTAFVPTRPVSPNRVLINIAGLMIGFLIGSAFFIVSEIFVSPIRRPEDLAVLVKGPFIVTIPELDSKELNKKEVVERLKVVNSSSDEIL